MLPCNHDMGCGREVAKCCLDCVLPACKYDDPKVLAQWRMDEVRRSGVVFNRTPTKGPKLGLTVAQTAILYGVSQRQASRIRSGQSSPPIGRP